MGIQINYLSLLLVLMFPIMASRAVASDLNRTLGTIISTTSAEGSFALISINQPAALVYSSNDFVGVGIYGWLIQKLLLKKS